MSVEKGGVDDQESVDAGCGSEDSVEDDRLVGYFGGADSASPAMPKKSPMPKTAAQAANAKDRQAKDPPPRLAEMLQSNLQSNPK